MKLTLKQQRFVDFYEGNATEAATKAGFSAKTAYSSGQRLLKNVEIKNLISKRNQKADTKKIMSRQERQAFWTSVANDIDASMNDRLRASELLGKSEADFTDKHLHSGEFTFMDLVSIAKK